MKKGMRRIIVKMVGRELPVAPSRSLVRRLALAFLSHGFGHYGDAIACPELVEGVYPACLVEALERSRKLVEGAWFPIGRH